MGVKNTVMGDRNTLMGDENTMSELGDENTRRSEEYKRWMESPEREFLDELSSLVVKSNPLVQTGKIPLTLQEYKLLLYIISKVKSSDDKFDYNTYDLSKLCMVLGIQKIGSNYRTLRKTLDSLTGQRFFVMIDGKYTMCRWVDKLRWDPLCPTRLEIRLDDDLRPFLLNLRKNFTAYTLDYVISMQSRYSIRLYEFLRSFLGVGSKVISVDELREILDAVKYEIFKDFRAQVIDKAVAEINAITDLMVEYSFSKTGRKYSHIAFTIRLKTTRENADALCRRLRITDDREEDNQ